MRILTWAVHGNYLWYLAQTGHELLLPVDGSGQPGYGGRGDAFPWPATVQDVPTAAVRDLTVDCVLFQHHDHWTHDQHRVLSDEQRRGPRVFVEHDPPRAHPTDTLHPVDDPDVLVVHVTDFNRLMWDNGVVPTTVIEHGVLVPDDVTATYELARGVTAINCLARRGRRLGADVFARWAEQVPLDLVGMDAEAMGGLGEVPPAQLPAFMAAYRCFVNPIRYTSLGLAVCEAMAIGLPVVALATTEVVTAIESGVHGFVATDPDDLVEPMRTLCADAGLARQLGDAARTRARERFAIRRFCADWDAVLTSVVRARTRR